MSSQSTTGPTGSMSRSHGGCLQSLGKSLPKVHIPSLNLLCSLSKSFFSVLTLLVLHLGPLFPNFYPFFPQITNLSPVTSSPTVPRVSPVPANWAFAAHLNSRDSPEFETLMSSKSKQNMNNLSKYLYFVSTNRDEVDNNQIQFDMEFWRHFKVKQFLCVNTSHEIVLT